MKKLVAVIGAMMCLSLLSGVGVAQAQTPTPSPGNVIHTTSGYAYGYGTYYVASRRSIPQTWGNAREWYARAQADGYAVGTRPAVGAIAWIANDNLGLGHVAIVETVSGDFITVSEMYSNGNWNRVTFRIVPANSFSYIY